MYGKMVLVLGIPWIFEGIHFFSHQHFEHGCHPGDSSEMLFRIFSILNFSRGIFLFLIFVCKRTVWTELKKVSWIHSLSSRCKEGRERAKTMETELGGDQPLEEIPVPAKSIILNIDNKVEVKEKEAKQPSRNLIQSTLV